MAVLNNFFKPTKPMSPKKVKGDEMSVNKLIFCFLDKGIGMFDKLPFRRRKVAPNQGKRKNLNE